VAASDGREPCDPQRRVCARDPHFVSNASESLRRTRARRTKSAQAAREDANPDAPAGEPSPGRLSDPKDSLPGASGSSVFPQGVCDDPESDKCESGNARLRVSAPRSERQQILQIAHTDRDQGRGD
jgi:hypothetical protein